MIRRPRLLSRLAVPVLALLTAWCTALQAGEFTINPLRVSLDRATRSGEITVRNDDTVPLRMQLEAMTWRQDGDGRDQYEPTDELIFFPRAMEIPPGESRVVRVGVRAAPVTREDAYRLFIEELPPPADHQSASQGTSLRIFLRVGVAVFVAPAQPKRTGEIARLDLRAGTVEWSVVNTGNAHFRAERVEVAGIGRDGSRLFVQDVPERYFLAGVAKTLRFDIPRDTCKQLGALEASVIGENLELKRKLDVDPARCP
ncbi:MAG TPA: fimbria/pilus periplasmic chaperone [Candidatus Tumulicola sp.]|jgi:fimbrial chaperone protein|nr:fimbria/pilus periplasmic chaperone [Candidatus Tumulicola sp.]